MRDLIAKNGLILAAFAIVTTALISMTHTLTAGQIARQEKDRLLQTLSSIVPVDSHDNDIQQDCVIVSDPSIGDQRRVYRARKLSEPVALAIEATAPDGYSGNIHILVGVDTSGLISGVRVLNHQETPGLGDKIDLRIDDWVLDFNQQQYNPDQQSLWAVRKDGGQFDQFTGATITPRAVVSAVRNAAEYARVNQQTLFLASSNCRVSEESQT